ncbi:MAG: M20/M25/M40 family metallo-hydrolase [Vicinamibacterales bacterium]
MRQPLRRAFLVALLGAVALGAGSLARLVAATPPIEPDRILEHIKFLASDQLQGRANGSAGLERAADYIAAEFAKAGLQPAGQGGNWFQPFELAAGVTTGADNALVVRTRGQSVRLSLGESYYPLAATPAEAITSLKSVPVVFGGYGISAPAFDYDDYERLDVSGKALLIFSHEPQERRTDSRLNGARPLRETTLYAKALAARSRGAVALVVVSDPSHPADEANYRAFLTESDTEDHGIPVLRVRRDEMAPILKELDLDGLAATIDRDLIPRSRPLPGVTIDYTQELTTNLRTVRNVVGILPGADSAKDDEAVVLGGHYDHVGLGGRFSSTPERTGEIHNGADDNASGIAALIEIARAAAADRARFPRSLIFIAFAGEERGLLGSVHYTSHPAVPLAETVAMVNLDMIGRARGRVEVGGLTSAASLREDVEAAAGTAGIDVRPGGPGGGRSDDASFLDRHIPSLHFFTGFHDDYHAPGDDWPRIDAAGTARVATLALELAARLATRSDRLQFAGR